MIVQCSVVASLLVPPECSLCIEALHSRRSRCNGVRHSRRLPCNGARRSRRSPCPGTIPSLSSYVLEIFRSVPPHSTLSIAFSLDQSFWLPFKVPLSRSMMPLPIPFSRRSPRRTLRNVLRDSWMPKYVMIVIAFGQNYVRMLG